MENKDNHNHKTRSCTAYTGGILSQYNNPATCTKAYRITQGKSSRIHERLSIMINSEDQNYHPPATSSLGIGVTSVEEIDRYALCTRAIAHPFRRIPRPGHLKGKPPSLPSVWVVSFSSVTI